MRYLANVSNSVAIDDRLNYQQNKQCFAKNARMLLPDKLRHFGIWNTGITYRYHASILGLNFNLDPFQIGRK